jgi:hypothetical protein
VQLVVPTFREVCHDATGGVVGGQIGYRWQSAGWVFGLEAQGDWADLKGSNVSGFIPAWWKSRSRRYAAAQPYDPHRPIAAIRRYIPIFPAPWNTDFVLWL